MNIERSVASGVNGYFIVGGRRPTATGVVCFVDAKLSYRSPTETSPSKPIAHQCDTERIENSERKWHTALVLVMG